MRMKKRNRMEKVHEIKREPEMKRKRLHFVMLVLTVLSLALSGCGMAAGEQEANLETETADAVPLEAETGESTSGAGAASSRSVLSENGAKIVFPERYNETMGNVAFNMDIVVNADLTAGSMVTA